MNIHNCRTLRALTSLAALAAALAMGSIPVRAQNNSNTDTNNNTAPVPSNAASVNDLAPEPQPWPGQNQTFRDNPNPFSPNQQQQRSSLQSEQSSPNLTDSDITNRVEHSIQQDTDLASRSGDVHVNSRFGKVVLRGTVQSQADKDDLGAKAADVAGPENVTNYLKVSGQ